ncbi:hypothetical protein H312_00603 [Anncaliia algerae PRA339]|uniref:Uncharacterized protein n=1 Tax=Anncaliia algerae PRA339 TaxID=1288291 RepID=A0A059F439_9MICR|nr:hypothetical protein H312_00603 [Anncaliia algerae PRA339]
MEIINSATTKEDLELSFDKKQQIKDESEDIKKVIENEDSESLINTQSSKESENISDNILPNKSNESENMDDKLTQEVINSSKINQSCYETKINDSKPIKTKDKIKRQSSFVEIRKIFESNESKNQATEKNKTTSRSNSFRSRNLEETNLHDIKYSKYTPVKYITPHNRLRHNDNCDKNNKEKEAIESMSPEEAAIYFKTNFTEKRQMFDKAKEEIPKPMGLLKIRGSIILNNNSSTKDTTSTAENEEERCESMNKSFRMNHNDKYLTSKSKVLRSNSSLGNPVTDTVNNIPLRMKYNNYSIERNPNRHTSLYHQFNPQCKRSTHSSTLDCKNINKTKVPLASSITSGSNFTPLLHKKEDKSIPVKSTLESKRHVILHMKNKNSTKQKDNKGILENDKPLVECECLKNDSLVDKSTHSTSKESIELKLPDFKQGKKYEEEMEALNSLLQEFSIYDNSTKNTESQKNSNEGSTFINVTDKESLNSNENSTTDLKDNKNTTEEEAFKLEEKSNVTGKKPGLLGTFLRKLGIFTNKKSEKESGKNKKSFVTNKKENKNELKNSKKTEEIFSERKIKNKESFIKGTKSDEHSVDPTKSNDTTSNSKDELDIQSDEFNDSFESAVSSYEDLPVEKDANNHKIKEETLSSMILQRNTTSKELKDSFHLTNSGKIIKDKNISEDENILENNETFSSEKLAEDGTNEIKPVNTCYINLDKSIRKPLSLQTTYSNNSGVRITDI